MLEGLGEPVRELREAIADIRYRGRHQQLDGELRLLEAAVELGLRYGALDEQEAAEILREKLQPIFARVAPTTSRPSLRAARRPPPRQISSG